MFLLLTLALADPAGGQLVETPPQLLAQAELHWPEGADVSQHGDVTVRVHLSETGAVLDVEVLDGPEVFHAEAIAAGHRLVFSPATRAGVSVSSSAVVYFHFAPSAESVFEEAAGVIVVHGDADELRDTHARTTLDEEHLEESASRDLAETVEQVPGVTMSSGTGDARKPIIRGQTERRLLVLEDGVRHESQKWGADHATEIDPFAAGSISVIRGAAGSRYGPDALGGVILVDPPPMRSEDGFGGKTVLAYSSNGQRPYAALRVDRGGPTALRVEGNMGYGASLSTPDYVLGNTASRTWNLGGAAQRDLGQTTVRVTAHHYDQMGGVFYGVQHASAEEFLAQLHAEVPVGSELWTTTYAIDRPYQAVQHDRVTLHLDRPVDWGELHAIYAFQLNRRQEYETARQSVTGPQYDFTLRTHSLDLAGEHHGFVWGQALLQGGFGLQAGFQENLYAGLPLLPNFRGVSGGVFAYERLVLSRVDIEVGARYDHLTRTAFMSLPDYERHERRGTLDAQRCLVDSTLATCPNGYDAGSVSLGVLFHVLPDTLDVKAEVSSASRFPNADELYLIGAAPTFPVYALGYPDLDPETTWGASATAGLRLWWVQAELSAYTSRVQDYIYFSPEFNDDGALHYDVTVRGAFPRYSYRPIDASFHGTDGRVQFGPEAPVGLEVGGSMVRAYDQNGAFLVGIPADRGSAALHVRGGGLTGAPSLSVRVDAVAAQSRVDAALDFAPAPDAYLLLGLGAQMTVVVRDRDLRVGVAGDNVLNTAYRDYSSLLRYTADQPGRDIHVRVGSTF